MKTPLWDIEPFPTLLFDPNSEHARKLATGLRKEGLPVEVAPNADAMLLTVRDRYFRTLVVAADLSDAACLAFLDKLRREAPGSWLIATDARPDEDALAIAHRHGVDALLAVPVAVPDLFARIAALQLRSRPRF